MIYFTLQFGINEQEEKNFRVFYLKVNKIKKKILVGNSSFYLFILSLVWLPF